VVLDGLPGGARIIGEPQNPLFVIDPANGQMALVNPPQGVKHGYPCVMTSFFSDQAVVQIANVVARSVVATLRAEGILPPLAEPPAQQQPSEVPHE
jgi:hypothetical protein